MKLSNQMRFILAVISGEVVVSNKRKAEIEARLDALRFDRIAPPKKVSFFPLWKPEDACYPGPNPILFRGVLEVLQAVLSAGGGSAKAKKLIFCQ